MFANPWNERETRQLADVVDPVQTDGYCGQHRIDERQADRRRIRACSEQGQGRDAPICPHVEEGVAACIRDDPATRLGKHTVWVAVLQTASRIHRTRRPRCRRSGSVAACREMCEPAELVLTAKSARGGASRPKPIVTYAAPARGTRCRGGRWSMPRFRTTAGRSRSALRSLAKSGSLLRQAVTLICASQKDARPDPPRPASAT